ncbi:hypothetical protein ACFQ8S_06825 [Streptomyces virginiae]|uniref:hypothetical protein n=1 Tax=Streptomyces virginiae TaxID=1961 RepID=UPI00367B251B
MTDQWWIRVEAVGNREETHATERVPGRVTLCGKPVSFPVGGTGCDAPSCEECANEVTVRTAATVIAEAAMKRSPFDESALRLQDSITARQARRAVVEADGCPWVVRHATLETPDEHCEADVPAGSAFCKPHQDKADAMDAWEKQQ